MDEFGQSPAVYVWPIDHVEGTAYPDDFWARLDNALMDAGIMWENV